MYLVYQIGNVVVLYCEVDCNPCIFHDNKILKQKKFKEVKDCNSRSIALSPTILGPNLLIDKIKFVSNFLCLVSFFSSASVQVRLWNFTCISTKPMEFYNLHFWCLHETVYNSVQTFLKKN